MKKKVLIVGGAGYIGSHCVKYFLEKGIGVIVFDNLSTGFENLVDGRVKFIKGDLLNVYEVEKVFSENEIVSVLHFAAFSLVGESVVNPSKYYKNNICGTINLLDIMVKFDVKKIIFSSTAAVYGNPEIGSLSEESEIKPINPYGLSKLFVEKILADYDKAYGLKSVILRYFNAAGAAYGIGENHNPESHLIPLVLKTALGEREFISIFGSTYATYDGTCVRDYIHVLDLVDAHFLAFEYLKLNGSSRVYNLGTNDGVSVREIVNLVKEITGVDFVVKNDGVREGDPAVLVADYSKIKNELGWNPQYSIKDIIRDAFEWHKNK